ncbi:UNVERIFIED_CONTAM: hypothetical protein Sradi_7234800, partial [Sesamum radiatum]
MVNSDVSGSTDVASQTELEAESMGGLNQNENGKSAKAINNSTLDSSTGHNPTAAEKGLVHFLSVDVPLLGIIAVRGIEACGNVWTVCWTIFRFDNFLAKQEGFLDSVQRIWRNNVHGTSMFAMVYTKAVTIEASMLHQRAKLQWMKHGDQNSKLFYMKIKARRAKQRIYHIKTPNGESLTDISAITGEFVDAFHTLLGGERRNRTVNIAFLQYNVRHTLTPTEADMLSAPVTGAEIKEALFDIAEDSAPGPDGYTSAFSKLH